jgi:hypothetical protein
MPAHGACRLEKIWSDYLGIEDNDDSKPDNLHYLKGIHTMLKKK